MKYLILLILCASQALGQEISCFYHNAEAYTCDLTIDNPTGFDGFTQIAGQHLDGFTDADVRVVRILPGLSLNLPSIICQQFPFTTSINQFPHFPAFQTLSESALWNCGNLVTLVINIAAITPPGGFLSRNPLLEEFVCEQCSFTDLPSNFFQSNQRLRTILLFSSNFHQFRAEWFQTQSNLERLILGSSSQLTTLPRNSFNSPNLRELTYVFNTLRSLDFFSFNQVGALETINLIDGPNPMEAMDWNIFDRALNLRSVQLGGVLDCARFGTNDFQLNRGENLAMLEPCFAAFDARMMIFSTTGLTQTFNSIRRTRILLSVQTVSDAIITFSSNPDGSGSNFEVRLGVDDNSRSEIWENGVLRTSVSTPGLLNMGQFVVFDITWQGGLVVVTHQSPFIIYQLESSFAVRFIGVGTRGLFAAWNIQQVVG